MEFFWFMLLLVIVVGNAMVLLRTARRPKIPDAVKPKPYQDDEDDDR